MKICIVVVNKVSAIIDLSLEHLALTIYQLKKEKNTYLVRKRS